MKYLKCFVGLALAVASGAAVTIDAQRVQVPIFEYDPTFPKPMPENWAIGAIGGIAVDQHDHIYVAQRPSSIRGNERFTGGADTPPKADCCIPAPPILEFDQAGWCTRGEAPAPGTTGRRPSTACSLTATTRSGWPAAGTRTRSC